jgi:hypothetical protein
MLWMSSLSELPLITSLITCHTTMETVSWEIIITFVILTVLILSNVVHWYRHEVYPVIQRWFSLAKFQSIGPRVYVFRLTGGQI